MKRADYPADLRDLMAALKRLPGVGARSAERMALWLLRERSPAATLAEAIVRTQQNVTACGVCGFFRLRLESCALCDDHGRDATVLCVVEQASDVLPLERTGAFTGHYHVLGGKLSPLNGVHPEDLRIKELHARLTGGPIHEVILALGSDVEGEATAHYLAENLARFSVRLTRLAQGLPAGGGLDHADELTLLRALSGRRVL